MTVKGNRFIIKAVSLEKEEIELSKRNLPVTLLEPYRMDDGTFNVDIEEFLASPKIADFRHTLMSQDMRSTASDEQKGNLLDLSVLLFLKAVKTPASSVRKQHVLPHVFLKHFTIPGIRKDTGQVINGNLATYNTSSSSVKLVAATKIFRNTSKRKLWSDELEAFFGLYETRFGELLASFEKHEENETVSTWINEFSQYDKIMWSLLMASFALRGDRQRNINSGRTKSSEILFSNLLYMSDIFMKSNWTFVTETDIGAFPFIDRVIISQTSGTSVTDFFPVTPRLLLVSQRPLKSGTSSLRETLSERTWEPAFALYLRIKELRHGKFSYYDKGSVLAVEYLMACYNLTVKNPKANLYWCPCSAPFIGMMSPRFRNIVRYKGSAAMIPELFHQLHLLKPTILDPVWLNRYKPVSNKPLVLYTTACKRVFRLHFLSSLLYTPLFWKD